MPLLVDTTEQINVIPIQIWRASAMDNSFSLHRTANQSESPAIGWAIFTTEPYFSKLKIAPVFAHVG